MTFPWFAHHFQIHKNWKSDSCKFFNTKNVNKNLVAYNINSDLRPVFRNKKIADDIKVAEAKPPFINQQCVVYKFKCDLCDADCDGYTCLHLFQRIEEHKHSAIRKHLRDAHNQKRVW